MIEEQVIVELDPGLESRPAAQFVQIASSFQSNIILQKEEKKLAAKSIMGVMASAIRKGDTVTLSASGPDEKAALQALSSLLKNEFTQ